MTGVMTLLFCVGAVWIVYAYIGYPLIMFMWGAIRPVRPMLRNNFVASVSVLIAARNEEKDIGWKVRETLSWDYPPEMLQLLVASDASDDGTDAILQQIRNPRLTNMRMPVRCGKNAALNRLVQLATGDLLFFTDANTHIGADRLRHIVRYFADARVGSVTGVECLARHGEDTVLESGVTGFLGYDALIKSWESKSGSVLVCDGALFCMRRELFAELDPELANDLELPLKVAHNGYWRLCDVKAQPCETSTHSLREEFARRRRICGQGILALWRLRKYLHGLYAFQFLSCKLLRWLTLIPMLTMLICSAALVEIPLFSWLFGIQIVGYGMAGIGALLSRSRHTSAPVLSWPFYFVLANVAALAGVVGTCSGRRFSVWDVASLSRGQEQPRQA